MSKFLNDEITLSVPQSGDIRTLRSELVYQSDMLGATITVRAGLQTDLGSIPSALRGIYPNDGKAMFPYILHDELYQSGVLKSQSKSDDMLEEAMKAMKVSWWRRKSIRLGLRVGGFVAWNNHRKKDKN